MIKAFSQFFTMLAVLFSAGERTARSLDNLAKWAEDESASFVSNAALEREAAVAKLMRQRDDAIAAAQSKPVAVENKQDAA